MAFDAGAAVARLVMNTTSWDAGSKKIQASQGKLAGVAKGVGAAFAAAGAAIVAGLVASVKKADEFNKEFANVSTLVDTSAVNMGKMQAQLLGLDSRLGSATELTNGLYQAISASVDPAKAVEFVGEAAKFAKAALIDTNTAVDVITTGLNAYGLEAEKATQISDQLFAVVKLGKTNGAELSSVIGQIIPMAANLGVGFDELGASIAIETRQGVSAAESTTQLGSIMTAMMKPSEDLKAALTRLGYESGEAAIKALGFKGTIEALNDSTGGSKEKLAGMFNNVRALKGVMALTGKGAADFSSVLDEIKNSAGATDVAFGKQQLTFETLRNTMDKAVIQIGNSFLPMVYGAVKSVNSFFEKNKAQITGILSNLPEVTERTFRLIKDIMKETFKPEVLTNIFKDISTGLVSTFQIALDFLPTLFIEAFKSGGAILKIITGGLSLAISDSFKEINIGKFYIEIPQDEAKIKKTKDMMAAAAAELAVSSSKLANEFQVVFSETAATWKTAAKSIGTNFKGLLDEYEKDIEALAVTTNEGVKNNVKETGASVEAASVAARKAVETAVEKIGASVEAASVAARKAVETAVEETGILVEEQAAAAETLIDDLTRKMEDGYLRMTDLEKAQIERSNELREQAKLDEIARQDALIAKYKETGESIISTMAPVLKELGNALIDQEAGWDGFKDAAKNAIATVIEAFAAQWAVMATAMWAAVFAGDLTKIPAATGYTAASAAGYIAGGAIRAMKDGGYATGLTLVGEEGPELVDFSGRPGKVYSNTETNNIMRPTNINIVNNVRDESDISRVNQLFGRTLAISTRAY